mgnify:CR=1 FL=1
MYPGAVLPRSIVRDLSAMASLSCVTSLLVMGVQFASNVCRSCKIAFPTSSCENSVDSGAAASVTNSYWDSNTSGIGGVNHGGGAPLTTATLQNGSLPTGFSSSIWNAASGRYPLLGPRILTINLTAQSTTYGTPYTLNQSAYTETENGVTLTGGNIVSLPGLTITVAGTGTSSGTTTTTNAGNYLLSAAGASASGFIISYGTAPSYLTVNPRVVTLTGTRTGLADVGISKRGLGKGLVGLWLVGLAGRAPRGEVAQRGGLVGIPAGSPVLDEGVVGGRRVGEPCPAPVQGLSRGGHGERRHQRHDAEVHCDAELAHPA